ncbi:MAG: 30S ribosomal protein S19e [Nanoarchaeota archaeon]
MTHILEVDPSELIKRSALELKKQNLVKPLPWSTFVKTGQHKQRLPEQEDWWYVRSASILRTVAKLGPVGTQKLRTKYGGRLRRGHQPEEFRRGSGSIPRKILQQLEKAQLLKQAKKGVHKGRVLTPKGISFLDRIAIQMLKRQSSKAETKE